MENNKIKTIIRGVLNEYKVMKINELSLNSDIVSDVINLISENPHIIKKLGFSSMKHLKGYIEDCSYTEFSDIRDEVNHLLKREKNDK